MKKLLCCIIFCVIRLVGNTQDNSYVLDMVHHNPGEPLTTSVFTDPAYLKQSGYNGQVINDFVFAHAALTFDKFDKRIFPQGSKEREWVLNAAKHVRENIAAAKKAGIKVYYFTDIVVLPKKLVELYHDEICDEKGKISFEKPKTIEIHRIMLEELFETFPDLDGLVIRTGETYLNNVPYHTGNNPITDGETSHVKLINLLREEVCVKRNKMLFYRTWASAGMDQKPDVYLRITNQIEPHPNLVFSVKHTKGDYQRTFDFNPTLTLGKHPQIVEVQCQREYEGKGAYPDYIMDGVINGFEEFNTNKPQKGYKSLNDIKGNANFKGIWSWSRGGGWVGPYISNEFWCKLNAYVISNWAHNTKQTEEQVFNRFMDENGIAGDSRQKFRELCLLSAKAVLRGHTSAVLPFENSWVWWMRDEFLSGTDDKRLRDAFKKLYELKLLDTAIAEKYQAVDLWKQIVALSKQVKMKNKSDQQYVVVSSQYGLLLHQIIAEGWNIMALGFVGDSTGVYDKAAIAASIKRYDQAWKEYEQLKKDNPSCATLYKPFMWAHNPPSYHKTEGMGASVDKYRKL
ncbi:MAG: hypothetical protein J0I41_14345 [Filimonas sp.]|nr:hypothetical protein [Filimonas sp.]